MTTLSLLLVSTAFGASEDVQLLVFSAPYCGACVKMEPALDRMRAANYPIQKINISNNPSACRQYRVNLLPTFVVLKNGREVSRLVGATSERTLRNMVLKHAKNGTAARASSNDSADDLQPRRRNLLAGLTGRRSRERVPDPSAVIRGNNSSDDSERHLREVPKPENSAAVAASVRIRVQDKDRIQMGSGTIIHSEPGNNIVLTCAHLVDQVSRDADVTIEVFQNGSVKRYRGKTLGHDINSDVALMVILSDETFPAAPLASLRRPPQTEQNVFSVGCGGGSIPTRQNMQIVEIDRYDGPANIECSTVPQQGRSGGALFNASGEVIGVCSAADEKLNEGLYAGPNAILAMIKRCQRSLPAEFNPARLYADKNLQPASEAYADNNSRTPPASNPEPDRMAYADDFDDTFSDAPTSSAAAASPRPPIARTNPADAVQGISGSEVTCLIRPRNGGKSRVVIIHRASNEFVQWLEGELGDQPRATMMTIAAAAVSARDMSESRMHAIARPILEATPVRTGAQPATVPSFIPGSTSPQPYRRSANSPRWVGVAG